MNKKELRKLSKNELIDLLLNEREARINLEEKVKEIERYLKAFDNPHTPSSKQLKKNTDNQEPKDNKKNESDKEKPRFPGKPPNSNGGGIKLPPADEVEEHKLDVSPDSGLPVGDPVSYRIKTIIDFPDKPIKVTKHIIWQYKDPLTNQIVEANVDLPKGVYGKNIKAIAALLKNLTNSHEKIACFLRELGAPSFSSTTVKDISTLFIFQLERQRTDILKAMRDEPYIHADETTMRRDGKNGYIWTVCTKLRAAFLAANGRARSNIIKLLRNFKGVLIVDGYGGYNWYPLKQRCWAHLIREFKGYSEDNREIEVQYVRLKALYDKMKILNKGPPIEKEIEKVKWALGDIVACLDSIKGADKLATLIKNGGNDWFTALYYEGVPLDNNHAEREIRPLVLLRKTIGCYRNWKGKRWIDVVVSVLHTWKLQGKNLFQNLVEVIG